MQNQSHLIPQHANSEDAVTVFESKFNIMPEQKPPLTAVIAFFLCAENSFWSMPKYSSFREAFKQSVASYMEIEPEKSAENAVGVLGDWPVTEDEDVRYRSALTNVLLEHRLSHPE